jgi:hypothetical protein
VSITAKVRPVAELASPAVGDHSTETLAGSPLLEVMADFANPMMQAAFGGDTLKVGRVIALFVPPMVKSDAPEGVDIIKVGGLGQPSIVNSKSTSG